MAHPTEEVVVALVAPVGANLDDTQRTCRETLEQFDYQVHELRLSDLLTEVFQLDAKTERDQYLTSRMDAGDKLRAKTGLGAALAMLAIHEIARLRGPTPGRNAFILRSLKTPGELALLRDVYGARLLTIGIHMPRRLRVDALAHRIAASHGSTHPPEWEQEAIQLINRDERDPSTSSGQNVRGTFPRADVFVDAAHRDSSQTIIERYLRASFSSPFETPTKDEFAMFHAWWSSPTSVDTRG